MTIVKKIRRLAGLPDISPARIQEFLATAPSAPPCVTALEKRSLAIIVPCFGHARFLNTMLTSITSQTRMPDEVIVVNDDSPDGSGDILERFIRERLALGCTRFSLIRNSSNAGQAASLNVGISRAASDLIMILNDDDYLMHDAVELVFALFGRYRDVALTGGSSIHFSSDEDLRNADKHISSHVAPDSLTLDVRSPGDVLHYRNYNDLNMTHSGCTFLKSAWELAGGYFPDKRKRLVPFSDRDFQLRVNALFPVALSARIPFSFWRSNSSVDAGRNS